MDILLEKISRASDKIIESNPMMDMTEKQMLNLINEDELFTITMTATCPTSFLICC